MQNVENPWHILRYSYLVFHISFAQTIHSIKLFMIIDTIISVLILYTYG